MVNAYLAPPQFLLALEVFRHLLLRGTNMRFRVGFSARHASLPNRLVGHFF